MIPSAPVIHPTPEYLWGSDKKLLPFGAYRDLIPHPLTQPWDGNGGWLSQRRWQRKAWVFIGISHPQLFAGLAVCDAGYLGKPFVYVYDVPNAQLMEDSASVPFAFDREADWQLDSDWAIKQYRIYTEGNELKAVYAGNKFQLTISVTLNRNGLSFICPSPRRPFHFTYKNLSLPAKVAWTYKGKTVRLDDALASIDFSKGYPPRHTFWNWTSFMGHTSDGVPVGVNLVNGFNDNIENALWLGNDYTQLLGAVQYSYARASEHNAWQVANADLQLDMPRPLGARREHLNLLVAKSQFIQVFGEMSGRVRIHDAWVPVQGYGVMEEHEAKW